MKIFLILAGVSLVAVVSGLWGLAYVSRSGHAPGLHNGHLSKCPQTPNCVCSEYPQDLHFIEPVSLPGIEVETGLSLLKTVLLQAGGKIQREDKTYLSAVFTSRLFGFVDDVELRIDTENGLIHLRSASRTGRSDLGVNRQRLEQLKKNMRRQYDRLQKGS